MMTTEHLVKVRQMLAKECADRKIYADALEAVSEIEALATMQAELTAAVEGLKVEKATLDGECDAMAVKLTEAEAKAVIVVNEAQNEAARIMNEAAAKAREIEADSGLKVDAKAKALKSIIDEIAKRGGDLAGVELQIATAEKTLEGIREKLKGI